ncbi:YggS family pyridoxal phosphate-dependent enzyme [Pokkaliibacter sp. CJK22405]|uniref:YggS family pyridoxal phosphate-dependent enzyme n=1 Tax=Pokkaliibacter sp. CJK22405 TaxID=3384615 RepID=UPI0039852F64
MSIAENIAQVYRQIEAAVAKAGRNHDSVRLLAVSKTKPADDVRAAYAAGQRSFGENYVQEGIEKVQALSDLDIDWHFIGPLQSNKTREVASHFDWVHSVDRLKIAQRLNDQRPDDLPPLNICIQVNVSGEDSKSGISPAELPSLVEAISQLPRLRLRGLMCIPAPAEDEAAQREPFHQLAGLLSVLPAGDTLSMGMSGDMEAAIAEGATWVRIGTAIFGRRDYSNH